MNSNLSASGKTLYVIAGPTASGKTAVSISLAAHLGTSVLSADSRQCYIGMPIGTAQPSPQELATVKHYFINRFPVAEHISAARYEELALGYLEEIFASSDNAVVCGGTGLYIRALCNGMDPMPQVDEAIVAQIDQQYRLRGLEWLQMAVATEDPDFYAVGEVENPARLLRALAFVRSVGQSITHFRTGNTVTRPFRIVRIALDLPRHELYQRIDARVDAMMQAGLLDEVRSLLPYRHLKNLQTVGYAELFKYLDGEWTLPFAVEKIKQHTRNYAKRQLTWFRREPGYHWLSPHSSDIVEQIVQLS